MTGDAWTEKEKKVQQEFLWAIGNRPRSITQIYSSSVPYRSGKRESVETSEAPEQILRTETKQVQ